MTSIELLKEIESWLCFNAEPSKEETAKLRKSIKEHLAEQLRTGCGCDDYNGFNCGCGHRAFLCDEALKELNDSTCH